MSACLSTQSRSEAADRVRPVRAYLSAGSGALTSGAKRAEAAASLTAVEVVGLDDPLRVLRDTGTFDLPQRMENE